MTRGHFLRQLRTLIWKDLLVEVRGREQVLAGAVFALLVLVIFNFAFDLRVENVAAVAPGVLWVTVTFAGVLSLGRAFARERDRRTLDAVSGQGCHQRRVDAGSRGGRAAGLHRSVQSGRQLASADSCAGAGYA